MWHVSRGKPRSLPAGIKEDRGVGVHFKDHNVVGSNVVVDGLVGVRYPCTSPNILFEYASLVHVFGWSHPM